MDVGLIALDMDGTLLREDDTISPANVAAIRAAEAAGIPVLMCTGRPVQGIRLCMENAGLFQYWMAGCNGAHIMDGPEGNVLATHTFPVALGKDIQDIVLQYPLSLGAFLEDEILFALPREAELPLVEIGLQERMRVRVDRERMRCISGKGVLKYVAFESEEQPCLAMAKERLKQLPGVNMASSWVGNVELNAPGVDKGAAVRFVAERLGLPPSRVMAVGDQVNDLPMLEWAGIGVAMGNAIPRVKAACGYHTDTCDEDGVARAIRRYALEGRAS